MHSRLALVEGAYLQDILEQPAAMRRTQASLAAAAATAQAIRLLCRRGTFDRIVLTGMGSSFHALHPLHLRLNQSGLMAQMIEASEAFHYLPGIFTPRTLTIAVSQSGESAEIVRLLDGGFLKGPLIGVTNTSGSTLARLASTAILTDAGIESTVSCKTYLAGLEALHWLGSVMLDEDLAGVGAQLESACDAVETYLEPWRTHVDSIGDLLGGIEQIFITGRGASLATAGTGGLILKESTRASAEGMSSAAFRHGPLEMLSRRVLACICLGDERTAALNQRLYDEAARTQASAFLIGHTSADPTFWIPAMEPALLPILEILPVQMLTLALAARLGFEAGRFSLASKITDTE